ncbi:MAG: radical SAM protein [Candidatus Ventricola sp.]
MNVLDTGSIAERFLCDKATHTKTPIGATFELTPLCNMDCRMCYVRMSPDELRRRGRLKSADEWAAYAEQAKEKGLLFLLLTGGEPFLYPEFRTLYARLKAMGLIVSVNTNGTLLNRETVAWLAALPPRRLNITVYGASDETYARLCGNPKGYSQVMHALALCREYGIQVKLNFTVTRENMEDYPAVLQMARENGLPVTVAYYVFPANRRSTDNSCSRLTPMEAADVRIRAEVYEMGAKSFLEKCKAVLAMENGELSADKPPHDTAFTCRAGTSTFWINWQGKMLLCGMTDLVQFDMDEHGFEKCWTLLQEAVGRTRCSEQCAECRHETVCARCAAAAIAETGTYEGTPSYLCELCSCYFERIRSIVFQSESLKE